MAPSRRLERSASRTYPTGDVYDGAEEVSAYFQETRAAFPDQRNELIKMHHAEDSVIVEFDLKGTHKGPLGLLE